MEIYKIIAVAVITAFLCVYLKNIGSDLFLPALIAGGIIILSFSVDYLTQTVAFINELTSLSGIDGGIMLIAVKVTLVAYLIEFACGLTEDAGLKSLSDKLAFAGRLVLVGMSIPVFSSLISLIKEFIGRI